MAELWWLWPTAVVCKKLFSNEWMDGLGWGVGLAILRSVFQSYDDDGKVIIMKSFV